LRERLKAGQRWHDSDLAFTSTIALPVDGRKTNAHFAKILNAAGLPLKRFHDLRHTCASLLLGQGIHPRVVMEILGHSQIGLTMNRFSHVIPALQEDGVSLLNALLCDGL